MASDPVFEFANTFVDEFAARCPTQATLVASPVSAPARTISYPEARSRSPPSSASVDKRSLRCLRHPIAGAALRAGSCANGSTNASATSTRRPSPRPQQHRVAVPAHPPGVRLDGHEHPPRLGARRRASRDDSRRSVGVQELARIGTVVGPRRVERQVRSAMTQAQVHASAESGCGRSSRASPKRRSKNRASSKRVSGARSSRRRTRFEASRATSKARTFPAPPMRSGRSHALSPSGGAFPGHDHRPPRDVRVGLSRDRLNRESHARDRGAHRPGASGRRAHSRASEPRGAGRDHRPLPRAHARAPDACAQRPDEEPLRRAGAHSPHRGQARPTGRRSRRVLRAAERRLHAPRHDLLRPRRREEIRALQRNHDRLPRGLSGASPPVRSPDLSARA